MNQSRNNSSYHSAYTVLSARQFLTKSNIDEAPHSTFSPDLAPCEFIIFPKEKRFFCFFALSFFLGFKWPVVSSKTKITTYFLRSDDDDHWRPYGTKATVSTLHQITRFTAINSTRISQRNKGTKTKETRTGFLAKLEGTTAQVRNIKVKLM